MLTGVMEFTDQLKKKIRDKDHATEVNAATASADRDRTLALRCVADLTSCCMMCSGGGNQSKPNQRFTWEL